MSSIHKAWPAALAALLAGCGAGGGAGAAEEQFGIAANAGTYADMCAAAGRAADEHLKAGDADSFRRWSLMRDVYCESARRDPDGRPQADGGKGTP